MVNASEQAALGGKRVQRSENGRRQAPLRRCSYRRHFPPEGQALRPNAIQKKLLGSLRQRQTTLSHHEGRQARRRAPRLLHSSAAPKILLLFYRQKPVSQGNLAIVLLVFSLWEIPWVRAAVAGVKFNLHWLKITEMTHT